MDDRIEDLHSMWRHTAQAMERMADDEVFYSARLQEMLPNPGFARHDDLLAKQQYMKKKFAEIVV